MNLYIEFDREPKKSVPELLAEKLLQQAVEENKQKGKEDDQNAGK